jgi:hypothetical protein
MYLTRRQALSSLAVTMIGVPALARDVALTAGLCGGPDLNGFESYCFTDSPQRSPRGRPTCVVPHDH